MAYRMFTRYIHRGQLLGRHVRRPLPSCCVEYIHTKFPSEDGHYTGFKEYSKSEKPSSKMTTSVVAYKGQKYSSLRKDMLKKGELFQDPEFPANNKSLFFSKVDADIEWKRPKELCKVPKLVVEGVSCDDLNEGELGNAWFVTACSSLTQEPKLWQKVVPNTKEQEYTVNEEQYAGIFHFQFWRYGSWIDVVIDDRLPTKNNRLVFCHSKSRNEFWSALLEKAYAKLYGDYETLITGYTADALVDFTGGVAEKLIVKDMELQFEPNKIKFFSDLSIAVENKSLSTCCIKCTKEEAGRLGEQGLIKGHGYGVTAVKEIKVNKGMKAALGCGENLFLVRLRNPWSTKEWTGAWSDESKEWNALSVKDREKLGIKFEQEGEFWMSFDDFIRHFTNIDICHFVNTSIFSLKKTWSECLMHGEWLTGARGTHKDRAGGCDSHNTFLFNPQYVFDVTGEEDTIMLSMEQDDDVSGKQTGQGHNIIGFQIMKVEDNRKFRIHEKEDTIAVSEYKESRSIFLKSYLKKGRYVVFPSTSQPGICGKFLLRMYTSNNAHARPLNKEFPKNIICTKPYVTLTRIKVIKAEGLPRREDKEKETVDPYVIVKCEGETVKSHWQRNTQEPTWDFKIIFYRKKPSEQPITIEISNHNRVLVDEFMGMATIDVTGNETPEVKEFDLFGKSKKEKEMQRPGKLFIEITSSDDLTAF